jgi:hypothetical protein
MPEIRAELLRTSAEPAAGPEEPGLILLAGTGGVLRRVRHDVQEIVAAFNDRREGVYLLGAKSADGHADVDFQEYIEWTASTGWEHELPRIERQLSGWTVLNVPLEYLAADEPR